MNEALCGKLVPVMGNMSMVILGVSVLLIAGQFLTCCIFRLIAGKTKD